MDNSTRGALNEYKEGARSGVEDATPHRLIQMLMEGVLDKVSAAKGFMQQGNIAEKGVHISWAISIIDGLKASLDKPSGGEIAENLESLYDYMGKSLLEANLNNDAAKLDEVTKLMKTIKEGWDTIPEDIIREHAEKKKAEENADEPSTVSGTGS